jgi:ferredoxin-NADP reductase
MSVRKRVEVSPSILVLELAWVDGTALPAWNPGAHIALHLPNEMERQYSLCGNPADREVYRIGVLREPGGRGGSDYIYNHLHEGATIEVSEPINTFKLAQSPRYHFIAAGIGITPILRMLDAAESFGAEWNLTYLGRSRGSMAFLDELERFGDRVSLYPKDESGRQDLSALIGESVQETLVYACGPESVLSDVEATMASWPSGSLHVERFAPKATSPESDVDSFEVKLVQSGLLLQVPPDKSILTVVEEAGIVVPFSCREGTCGTCETLILAGKADHRDSVLSPEEQESNETMMICVSRAMSPLLELDL